jgi:hypothetical protein
MPIIVLTPTLSFKINAAMTVTTKGVREIIQPVFVAVVYLIPVIWIIKCAPMTTAANMIAFQLRPTDKLALLATRRIIKTGSPIAKRNAINSSGLMYFKHIFVATKVEPHVRAVKRSSS